MPRTLFLKFVVQPRVSHLWDTGACDTRSIPTILRIEDYHEKKKKKKRKRNSSLIVGALTEDVSSLNSLLFKCWIVTTHVLSPRYSYIHRTYCANAKRKNYSTEHRVNNHYSRVATGRVSDRKCRLIMKVGFLFSYGRHAVVWENLPLPFPCAFAGRIRTRSVEENR